MWPIAIVGTTEIIIIALVIIVLFVGIKRLPELGRSLAEGIHEFKKASKKVTEDDESKEAGGGK